MGERGGSCELQEQRAYGGKQKMKGEPPCTRTHAHFLDCKKADSQALIKSLAKVNSGSLTP